MLEWKEQGGRTRAGPLPQLPWVSLGGGDSPVMVEPGKRGLGSIPKLRGETRRLKGKTLVSTAVSFLFCVRTGKSPVKCS